MGTKTHIWAHFTPPQPSHPSGFTGLTEKFLTTILNAANLNRQSLWAKWVRDTYQYFLANDITPLFGGTK